MRYREDVRVVGVLDPNCHPGLVAPCAIRLGKSAGNLGGTARIVDVAYLEDSHCGMDPIKHHATSGLADSQSLPEALA